MEARRARFIERAWCPACQCPDSRTLYDCPFDRDPIRQYLRDFYEPQGGAELECLEGARYVARPCRAPGQIGAGEARSRRIAFHGLPAPRRDMCLLSAAAIKRGPSAEPGGRLDTGSRAGEWPMPFPIEGQIRRQADCPGSKEMVDAVALRQHF